MATKTISLDLEAYRRLKQARKENESFSETIKRVVKPRPDLGRWVDRAATVRFGHDFIEAVEQQILARSRPSRRSRGR